MKIVIILLFTIGLITYHLNKTSPLPADKSYGTPAIGGAFSLINQDGNIISDEQFRGKYMLVFFGFTNCPEICPTTLATFDLVIEALGDKAQDVAPIFITIDPKRDTPEVIKQYLKPFSKEIIGLTGSEAQIKRISQQFKIYYKKAAEETPDQQYGMEHSSITYLMDKQGKFIQYFPYNTSHKIITKTIKALPK